MAGLTVPRACALVISTSRDAKVTLLFVTVTPIGAVERHVTHKPKERRQHRGDQQPPKRGAALFVVSRFPPVLRNENMGFLR